MSRLFFEKTRRLRRIPARSDQPEETPTPTGDALLTEAGDTLTTEAGDRLLLED